MKKYIPLFKLTVLKFKINSLPKPKVWIGLCLITGSICILLSSCSKKNVVPEPQNVVIPPTTTTTSPPPPPPPAIIYTEINNPAITLTNYTFAPASKTNFVGKILPAVLSGNIGFSKEDSVYVVFKHDSLFLTDAGKTKILSEKALDISVQINDAKLKKGFKLVLNEFITNRVIAHRGAYLKLGYPENSMASLKQAIALGCQASETDSHLTADKQLVICHDDTYGGLTIEKSTYAELAAIKLPNGETLPLVKDYILQVMSQNKTMLELEMKTSIVSAARGLESTDSLVSLVHQLKAQAWIHYTTFGYDIAQRMELDDPTAKAEYINGDVTPAKLKADGIWGLNYHQSLFTNPGSQLLKDAHNNGINAIAWTVDDAPTMSILLNTTVDGIVTNYPELLLSLIKK